MKPKLLTIYHDRIGPYIRSILNYF